MAVYFHFKKKVPLRLPTWDYRWDGTYFITTCTKNREYYFGKIENKEMMLSAAGILASVFWHEIKNHTKGVALGPFVVMPDHVHGIITLNNDNPPASFPRDQIMSPELHQPFGKNSLSSIIGGYKAAVSKHAHRLGLDFEWQPRFYDVIIRGEEMFNRYCKYILDNPKKWNK